MKINSKLICVISVLVLLVALSSCGVSDSSSTSTSSEKVETAEKSEDTSSSESEAEPADDTAKEEASSDQGDLGDYTFAIKDAVVTKDWDDKDVLVVKYEFTNNGEKAASFMFAASTKAFQDGIELSHSFLGSDNELYNDNSTKDIKTGATLEVMEAYELSNGSSPVEVELAELISLSDKKLVKTFELE